MYLEPATEVLTKLKDMLEKSGMKLFHIAEKAGLQPSHLSDIKNGKKGLDIPKLYRIAKAMDAYPSDILPDSWIRPEARTDRNRIERAVCSVLKSYIKIQEEHGEGFASPEQLAQVVSVLLEDEGSELSPSEITKGLKMAKRFAPILK
ncbi:MAG: helix-turn-helix transcriptional regulator [Rickettsiales bacterium]